MREKRESLKNNRTSKKGRENNQMNMLKENPLFQNIDQLDDTKTKNLIETMASKISNDPKQKKNIKKQMENLINKMKESDDDI